MRTIEELESIITTYQAGPILPGAAKELLQRYKELEAKHKALRTAYTAETDGLDPDEAEKRFLK